MFRRAWIAIPALAGSCRKHESPPAVMLTIEPRQGGARRIGEFVSVGAFVALYQCYGKHRNDLTLERLGW